MILFDAVFVLRGHKNKYPLYRKMYRKAKEGQGYDRVVLILRGSG